MISWEWGCSGGWIIEFSRNHRSEMYLDPRFVKIKNKKNKCRVDKNSLAVLNTCNASQGQLKLNCLN